MPKEPEKPAEPKEPENYRLFGLIPQFDPKTIDGKTLRIKVVDDDNGTMIAGYDDIEMQCYVLSFEAKREN